MGDWAKPARALLPEATYTPGDSTAPVWLKVSVVESKLNCSPSSIILLSL